MDHELDIDLIKEYGMPEENPQTEPLDFNLTPEKVKTCSAIVFQLLAKEMFPNAKPFNGHMPNSFSNTPTRLA